VKELTARWNRAVSSPGLTDTERRQQVEEALEAADIALAHSPEHPEILTLKSLLLRLLATVAVAETNRATLLEEADALQRTAIDLQNRQQS
jgi:hypothetical protein